MVALLKRVKPNIVSEEATYLDLKIDRESMKVFRKEKEITLGPKEYKLLDFLIKQPKRVYSREQLLEHVWGDDINVESRTCLLYTSPSPRDTMSSRMPSSA